MRAGSGARSTVVLASSDHVAAVSGIAVRSPKVATGCKRDPFGLSCDTQFATQFYRFRNLIG